MTKVGGITTMINAAASMESAGVWVMLFIMIAIMVLATLVTGSGNAAFFAFSPLLPQAASSVGMSAAVLAVPVQLSAGIARTMCPIAGVTIAVSSIAGITPFQLVRRTIPVMVLALITNLRLQPPSFERNPGCRKKFRQPDPILFLTGVK